MTPFRPLIGLQELRVPTRALSCHSALPLAAQPHSHCSPGCHFVILGEYDRASGAEPLQVCPSCAECLGRRRERKGGQCRCVGPGGEELTGCLGLNPGTHHPGGLCPCPSYTAPSWLHRHTSWNPTTMNNDLTLLTLASPAQYTMCVSPVFLASSNEALSEGLTWLGVLSRGDRDIGVAFQSHLMGHASSRA